jgi:nicotinamidase-related amidase
MLKVYSYMVMTFCVLSVVSGLLFENRPAAAQDVIAEWGSIKTPPPPELKDVTIDPKTTAFLLLDFNKQTCNAERRPRCIASIPKMKKLLDYVRSKGILVVYSLSAGAAPGDIATNLAPMEGDPVVTSGPDKFMGTDLEKILTGTAAHGAVLYTASGAALRGMQVIVPVDGMSAENVYAEQYVAWNLVNAPRVSAMVTLTRAEKIK